MSCLAAPASPDRQCFQRRRQRRRMDPRWPSPPGKERLSGCREEAAGVELAEPADSLCPLCVHCGQPQLRPADRALLERVRIDHVVMRLGRASTDAADDDAVTRPGGEEGSVICRNPVAFASPGDQVYTSGPVEPSSGIAEKASVSPFGDQSGAAPALWTLSRIDRTANPGTALAGGALG